MQRERMADGEAYVPSLREYSASGASRAARVRPGQLVMHPGPMNRGVEIAGDVADGPNSEVVDQVRAGWSCGWRSSTTCSPARGRPASALASCRPSRSAAGQEVA